MTHTLGVGGIFSDGVSESISRLNHRRLRSRSLTTSMDISHILCRQFVDKPSVEAYSHAHD